MLFMQVAELEFARNDAKYTVDYSTKAQALADMKDFNGMFRSVLVHTWEQGVNALRKQICQTLTNMQLNACDFSFAVRYDEAVTENGNNPLEVTHVFWARPTIRRTTLHPVAG
jgi:hypothetical protein